MNILIGFFVLVIIPECVGVVTWKLLINERFDVFKAYVLGWFFIVVLAEVGLGIAGTISLLNSVGSVFTGG